MRKSSLMLTLVATSVASADLYSLEFTAVADFVGPVTGALTLDLDATAAGSFTGLVGTNFGPAAASGSAIFAPALNTGSILGDLNFGPAGVYTLDLAFLASGTGAGTISGFDPGAGGVVTGDIFVSDWSITAVPAPGALALIGLAGLGRRRRA